MLYKLLADAVVLLHFLWICFLVLGGLLGVRTRWVMVLHGMGLGFALVMQIFGWYCPLTHLEVWLRQRHDQGIAYAGSFIAHYAEKIVYLEVPPGLLSVLTVMLCSFNGWLYLRQFRRHSGRRKV